MRKLFISFFIIYSCFMLSLCRAAEVGGANLKFTPDGGGKYIYCNNQEFITRAQLADYGFEPTYLMSADGIEKGKYTLYFSHINRTELKNIPPYDTLDEPQDITDEEKSYYSDIKYPGFAIEVDVCLEARSDTAVKITSVGFEVQQPRNYYYTNRLINYEDSWGCLNAVTDYLKTPIYTQGSEYKYEPVPFEEKTFTIKKGETVWFSDYIDNYEAVGWLKPVHLLCDFEITEGAADLKIAAVRSRSTLRDRSGIREDAAAGRYLRDGQYKGIADSLPSVTAPLEFEIDDSLSDGSKLPVTIFNQYLPDGLEVTEWLTHINPQNDRNVVRTAAESDLLTLYYYDSEKEKLYSKDYAGEKDNVWIFSPFYSDTREGGNPNYPLDTSKYNVKKSASLANYCVKTNYRIKIRNNGEKTRYFNYNAKCTSNLLAWITDKDDTPENPYITAKGYKDVSQWETLCTKELPPNEATEFTLTVFLPINYTGGIRNAFTITDEAASIQFFDDLKQSSVRDTEFTGKNYVTYKGGNFYVSDDKANERVIPAEENVKKIFSMDENAYKILWLSGRYFIMYKAFAETPAFYSNMTKHVSYIYVLDEDFHLTDTLKFRDGYPFMLSYAGGEFFVRSDITRKSKDLKSWQKAEFFDSGSFSLPFDNGSGIILLPRTGGETWLSPDGGENYYKISYPDGDKPPRYIDCFGDLYFYAEDDMLYTSTDGIYWDSFLQDAEITKISREQNDFVINDTIRISPEKKPLKKQLIINSELIKFSGETVENPSDLLVPAEEILKKAQLEYFISKDKKILIIKKDSKTYELHQGSNIIITKGSDEPEIKTTRYSKKLIPDKKDYLKNTCILKDDIFLIPAADVFSALGYECEYFENSKCYVISN